MDASAARSGELLPLVREALRRGGRVRVVATGCSMRPFVRSGETVELAAPPPPGPALGSVVLVEDAGGRPLLHRVVRRAGAAVFTRGDAGRDDEGPFPPERVVAVVTGVVRGGRVLALDRGLRGALGRAWSATRRGPALLRAGRGARLVLYSLLPTLVLVGTLEAGLRLAGFEFHGVPTHLRFGPNLQGDMERHALVPDPQLFWRLREGGGAPAPGVAAARPAVLALGDSCTFFGGPAWPARLEEILRGRRPGATVRNAAVPGYSSHQGRVLLEGELAPLRPEWVVVYFGWNDHWLGLSATDREAAAGTPAPGGAGARLARRLRIVQAGAALRAAVATPPPERRPFRVPPEEYRENLAAICRAGAARGARVALVTAPAALDAEDLARLRAGGYAAPGADPAAIHERYNAITREVAAACGAALVDFAAAPPPGAVGADGIHLAPAGAAWLAGRVAALLAP